MTDPKTAHIVYYNTDQSLVNYVHMLSDGFSLWKFLLRVVIKKKHLVSYDICTLFQFLTF